MKISFIKWHTHTQCRIARIWAVVCLARPFAFRHKWMAIYFDLFCCVFPASTAFHFYDIHLLFIRIFKPLQFSLHTNTHFAYIVLLYFGVSVLVEFCLQFWKEKKKLKKKKNSCFVILFVWKLCCCHHCASLYHSTKFARLPFSCHIVHMQWPMNIYA